MESESRDGKVTFGALQARLIRLVNARVQSGDFTERGLARFLGISQPQMHNVLKGARKLRPELADRLLSTLDMTALDLLEAAELEEQLLSRPAELDDFAKAERVPGWHVAPKRLSGARPRKPASRETQTDPSYGKHAS